MFDESHRQGVDGGRDADGGGAVQTGNSGSSPHHIGSSDRERDVVEVTVEDKRRNVNGGLVGLGVFSVHTSDLGEVAGGEVSVGCQRID
jgi:hypothetical protein